MGKEVFSKISLPESFDIKEEGWEKRRSFGILNGSIVVFHYRAEMIEKIFDVWEMWKEADRSVVLWSKLLTIGPLFGIDKPLLFLHSFFINNKSRNIGDLMHYVCSCIWEYPYSITWVRTRTSIMFCIAPS